MRDSDVSQLQEWLHHHGIPAAVTTVHQAFMQRAEECAYHPLRQQLDALVWDKNERAGMFLPRYFGAPNTPYTRAIGQMFLISMVARIFKPGCQCDYMLIIEGGQGDEKSKACRILAGDEYFDDHLPPLGTKDCAVHLAGKWLIEDSEFTAHGRAMVADLKSFLTRMREKFRPRTPARKWTSPANASSSAPSTTKPTSTTRQEIDASGRSRRAQSKSTT
jgi:predicted P-loop ATPase